MLENFRICEEGKRKFLLLVGPWTKELGRLMLRERLVGLRLSAYAGFTDRGIAFLRDLTFLENLDLWVPQVDDINPLYALPNLRVLSLSGVRRQVDFTRLPRLEDLHLSQWSQRWYGGVFACQHLRNLGVSGFSGLDLQSFGSIQTLENLAVSFSKLNSLAGIDRLPRLVRLSLAKVNHLRALNGIEGCNRLSLVWIEGAKLLARLDGLAALRGLRTLNLTDCPNIETLQPISGLPQLEAVWFFGTTNIRDSNLSPLTTLPKLTYAKFVDREHYNHRSAEFPKSIPVLFT
jgi:Leucine-rich repeat (LRR) protein